jgi:hypothetical protein
MLRLFVILTFLALSCKKNNYTTPESIPQSIIDHYTGTCRDGCTVNIRLVEVDNKKYYGDDYTGNRCPNLLLRRFYYQDGTEVKLLSDSFYIIAAEGQYKQILWQCN